MNSFVILPSEIRLEQFVPLFHQVTTAFEKACCFWPSDAMR